MWTCVTHGCSRILLKALKSEDGEQPMASPSIRQTRENLVNILRRTWLHIHKEQLQEDREKMEARSVKIIE
jgi:hypothetical protein